MSEFEEELRKKVKKCVIDYFGKNCIKCEVVDDDPMPPIRSDMSNLKDRIVWYKRNGYVHFSTTESPKVIFNEPATILYKDGKKYVSKCDKEDKFSEELGLALCLLKSFGVSYSDFEKLLKSAKRQGGK